MYMNAESVDRAPRERMSMADARQHLAEAIDRTRKGPVTLTRRGRPAAVLVDAEEYERMLSDLEDAYDVSAAQAAIEEPGESIPWAQVKGDLGL
jgi:antitoxin Phd